MGSWEKSASKTHVPLSKQFELQLYSFIKNKITHVFSYFSHTLVFSNKPLQSQVMWFVMWFLHHPIASCVRGFWIRIIAEVTLWDLNQYCYIYTARSLLDGIILVISKHITIWLLRTPSHKQRVLLLYNVWLWVYKSIQTQISCCLIHWVALSHNLQKAWLLEWCVDLLQI